MHSNSLGIFEDGHRRMFIRYTYIHINVQRLHLHYVHLFGFQSEQLHGTKCKFYKVKRPCQHPYSLCSPHLVLLLLLLCCRPNTSNATNIGPTNGMAANEQEELLENCIFTERDNFSYLQVVVVVVVIGVAGMHSLNLLSFPSYIWFCTIHVLCCSTCKHIPSRDWIGGGRTPGLVIIKSKYVFGSCPSVRRVVGCLS